jgi:hypothetical protein
LLVLASRPENRERNFWGDFHVSEVKQGLACLAVDLTFGAARQ